MFQNTKFDFRNFKVIGTNRFDDYFVLNKTKEAVASIYDPNSKIKMEVYHQSAWYSYFYTLKFRRYLF